MGDAPAFNLLGRQFRPNDKGFDGASGQPRRDDPVEFEAEDNEADPFGLSSTSTAAAYKSAARDRPRWRGGVWRGGRWRLSIAYNSCAYIIYSLWNEPINTAPLRGPVSRNLNVLKCCPQDPEARAVLASP